MIVGFPEETDAEFKSTLDFIKKCQFASMHIFPYSIRPGTPAAEMKQVEKAVKDTRAHQGAAVADGMHKDYLHGCVGEVYRVLFEQEKAEGFAGHAPNYMEVCVQGQGLHNQVHPVRITSTDGEKLFGTLEVAR